MAKHPPDASTKQSVAVTRQEGNDTRVEYLAIPLLLLCVFRHVYLLLASWLRLPSAEPLCLDDMDRAQQLQLEHDHRVELGAGLQPYFHLRLERSLGLLSPPRIPVLRFLSAICGNHPGRFDHHRSVLDEHKLVGISPHQLVRYFRQHR